MRVLTVNAGSTSFKLEWYDAPSPLPNISEPPVPSSRMETQADAAEEALASVLRDGVDVVAHRFVRLPDGTAPVVRLGPAEEVRITAAGTDAPLHDASALRAVAIVARAYAGWAAAARISRPQP